MKPKKTEEVKTFTKKPSWEGKKRVNKNWYFFIGFLIFLVLVAYNTKVTTRDNRIYFNIEFSIESDNKTEVAHK